MRMPVMNGLELITKARTLYSGMVFFILTGFESNEEIEEALEKELIQHIFIKPLNVIKIEEAIIRCCA
jgi:YesN/AraC family two-component response regulator